MSNKDNKQVIKIDNLFKVPYKNVGIISFQRAGSVCELSIQSLNENEQEDLRNVFPQPDAPVKMIKKLDENGNPILMTKGPRAGNHIMEESKDYEDKEYLKAYSKYVTDVAAGAAAIGMVTTWARDKKEKEDDITLEMKIGRLKDIFNYDSINYIGQEVLKLSTISSLELDEAIKN